MINTSRFLIGVFSICILTIGVIFLWPQIIKPNNAELPSISQQSEDHDETLRVETPKRRPFLTKKRPRQHVIPQKQMLQTNSVDTNRTSSFDSPVIRPSQIYRHKSFLPKSSLDNTVIPPPTFLTDVPLDSLQFHPTISPIGLIYMYNQGKFDLDYVVDYLESQHHFDAAILEKLDTRRAFRYLGGTLVSSDVKKAYAKRILTDDPDNPDARAHLVIYEPDNTKAVELYREILIKHPNHPPTLAGLGYCLLEHSPEDALQYLKKANRLDPTIGLFSLGLVYEKFGDFKSAWFCYNKTVLNRKRWKARFPPSRIHQDFFLDEMKLSAIEGGEQWRSVIKLVPDPNGNANRMVRTFQPVNAQQKREIEEFYQFRNWVRNIENRKHLNQNNDFLVIEIEKHLNGGKPMFDPERIVRAYEITTRYPGKEGIQHLKKTDPEIALEIERLLQEE